MRRIFGIGSALIATATLLVVGSGASDEPSDEYLVRAIFDNASFLVEQEEVRIGGARVGEVQSVGVTLEGERAHADGSDDPGKAIVVMSITEPGFQDWRQDASCLVRPQSLLGEKFVECEPTQVRAPGTEPPPELEVIPEGEPGEGQRFLPVENNGKSVDLDLINNIMREPYPDRFRLILNELGIGLATRGEDLEEIIVRGNPALRETNELLALLKGQTQALNDLARDGDRSLAPLAREREHLTGFINNATVSGEATAERSAELEEGLQKMPAFFRELRLTMTDLTAFTDAATPVISNLGEAAPELTRSTRALGPFSRAGREASISLGDAAEDSEEDLVASKPVIRDLRELATETEPTAVALDGLLTDFREDHGLEFLMRFFFYAAGATNGYDSFGHFIRTVIPVNNCFTYKAQPEPGCEVFFLQSSSQRAQAATAARSWRAFADPKAEAAEAAALELGTPVPVTGDGASGAAADSSGFEAAKPESDGDRDARALLDFMVGREGAP
jgi:ABC-type transporter Mla subunit MlaD